MSSKTGTNASKVAAKAPPKPSPQVPLKANTNTSTNRSSHINTSAVQKSNQGTQPRNATPNHKNAKQAVSANNSLLKGRPSVSPNTSRAPNLAGKNVINSSLLPPAHKTSDLTSQKRLTNDSILKDIWAQEPLHSPHSSNAPVDHPQLQSAISSNVPAASNLPSGNASPTTIETVRQTQKPAPESFNQFCAKNESERFTSAQSNAGTNLNGSFGFAANGQAQANDCAPSFLGNKSALSSEPIRRDSFRVQT